MILVLCFLSALSLWCAQIRRDQFMLAERIAPKILRFHVIANSNSAEDQEIKLKVKSYLLETIDEKFNEYTADSSKTTYSPKITDSLKATNSLKATDFLKTTDSLKTIDFLKTTDSSEDFPLTDSSALHFSQGNTITKDELTAFLSDHKEELEYDTEMFIRRLGKAYPVSFEVTRCEFPEKFYGNVRLPAGTYEAAQVKIGSARGHNWWCILYPKVCITKDAVATVPEASLEELRNLLSREDYQKLLLKRPELLPEFHLSFYALDALKKWRAYSVNSPSPLTPQ